MATRFAMIFALFAVTLGTTGCNTIFDYSAPKIDDSLADATTLPKVAKVATDYAAAYETWHQWLANTPQVFEVPIIGTGIAAAAELAYGKAHPGPITSVALAGGGLAAIETYYAPKQRMLIYLAGSDAMNCVAGIANQLTATPIGVATRFKAMGVGAGAVTTLGGLAAITPVQNAKLTFELLTQTDADAVQNLKDAIQQINSRIVTRGSATAAQPDPQKIAADLKKAAQSDANVQHNTMAALETVPGVTPDQIGEFLTAPAINELTNFNTELTACIAKAG